MELQAAGPVKGPVRFHATAPQSPHRPPHSGNQRARPLHRRRRPRPPVRTERREVMVVCVEAVRTSDGHGAGRDCFGQLGRGSAEGPGLPESCSRGLQSAYRAAQQGRDPNLFGNGREFPRRPPACGLAECQAPRAVENDPWPSLLSADPRSQSRRDQNSRHRRRAKADMGDQIGNRLAPSRPHRAGPRLRRGAGMAAGGEEPGAVARAPGHHPAAGPQADGAWTSRRDGVSRRPSLHRSARRRAGDGGALPQVPDPDGGPQRRSHRRPLGRDRHGASGSGLFRDRE